VQTLTPFKSEIKHADYSCFIAYDVLMVTVGELKLQCTEIRHDREIERERGGCE